MHDLKNRSRQAMGSSPRRIRDIMRRKLGKEFRAQFTLFGAHDASYTFDQTVVVGDAILSGPHFPLSLFYDYSR